jgi:hypothetical protein
MTRIVEFNMARSRFRDLVDTLDIYDEDWRFYSPGGRTWPGRNKQSRLLEVNRKFTDDSVADGVGHSTSRIVVRVNDQAAMVLRLSHIDVEIYPVPADSVEDDT